MMGRSKTPRRQQMRVLSPRIDVFSRSNLIDCEIIGWEMDNSRLLKFGLSGSVVAALSCFTPLLILLFTVLGLGAWIGVIDIVLMPVFIG